MSSVIDHEVQLLTEATTWPSALLDLAQRFAGALHETDTVPPAKACDIAFEFLGRNAVLSFYATPDGPIQAAITYPEIHKVFTWKYLSVQPVLTEVFAALYAHIRARIMEIVTADSGAEMHPSTVNLSFSFQTAGGEFRTSNIFYMKNKYDSVKVLTDYPAVPASADVNIYDVQGNEVAAFTYDPKTSHTTFEEAAAEFLTKQIGELPRGESPTPEDFA